MDDLNEKITALLSDPSAIEGIRNMAAGLLGGGEPEIKSEPTHEQPDIDIGKIMGIMGKLNKRENDERTSLLLALKPHISEKRRERVDRAIKILKLIDMLPLLQDSGIFNFL